MYAYTYITCSYIRQLQHNSITYLQSNKVKSSNHMEQMGLERALQFLADNSLHVATFAADRHIQIAKYMVEVKPDIEHLYGI